MSSKRYPEEFKIEAVKQITENRYPIVEVARRLGVSQHSLYQWVKHYGLWTMGIRAGAIAPTIDIPDGKKGVDWLDVLNLVGKSGFPALGSVEKALARAA